MNKDTRKFIIRSVCEVALVLAIFLSCSRSITNTSTGPNLLEPNFDSKGYWRTPDFVVKQNPDKSYSLYGSSSLYGTYLAARGAHLRQDFDTAVEYYKLVQEKDKDNSELNQMIYNLLALVGEIDEAAPYAEQELETHPHESTALFIMSVKSFADGDYEAVHRYLAAIQNQHYEKYIIPFFNAWVYAAENKSEDAIKSLQEIEKIDGLKPLVIFHNALIYDVLGDKEKAAENYALIVSQYPQEVTFRILEVTTDFYARYGDKNEAYRILNSYNDNTLLATLLNNFKDNINEASDTSRAIIDTPQKGLAEALFNIGTIFRLGGDIKTAHENISAASYLNPEYDIAKIALANILEEQGLLKEANRYYSQIDKTSGSYFIAQMKMIENYNSLKDYANAEKHLQNLLNDYPDNTQLLGDLGNLASLMHKDEEAIKIFHRAINAMSENNSYSWPVYYSLAASYDKLNRKDKAEEYLLQALKLSNNDPNILNYLGFFWLSQEKNIDDAVQMIVSAYQQYPFEGHIIDSLGWVFYRIGNYPKAIAYLEKASDLNPGNAVISDHLGDAYWAGGRKNEAVFQWEHALVLKEDAELINRELIQQKIDNGGIENKILEIQNPELKKVLDTMQLK